MAEERNDSTQEKTQPATPRRLEQLREQGQVPRSQDLGASGVLIAGAAALVAFGSGMIEGLLAIMRAGFTLAPLPNVPFDAPSAARLLAGALGEGLRVVAPLLVVVAVAAVLAPVALGGWVLSARAFEPKLTKLDPIQGLRRKVFTLRGLVEMFKAAAKFVLVAAAAVVFLVLQLDAELGLALEETAAGIGHAAVLLMSAFLVLALSMLVIAAIDVPFQKWNFARQHRMSFEEIKREHRNEEGAPELRARVRALQREIAERRMMEAVPTADVIITNPTHYAVALQYTTERRESAPRVVAAGVDLVAARIRIKAQAHRVPVVEAPALARAVYRTTEIGAEIPYGLYTAVAIVLRYAYRLRGMPGFQSAPPPPPDLPIPPQMRFE